MKQAIRWWWWPLGGLYHAITAIRNRLFDWGLKKSTPTEVFSLGVGNLSVGGTGKTPMVRYLFSVFPTLSTATLSRGYGRKTRGFREVTPQSLPQEVGDEPLLFPQEGVRSFVGEDRVSGWRKIQEHFPEVKLLILDDVFQHRAIRPSRYLLLTTYAAPFFRDWVLPVGRLRESRAGGKRADAVVVTKCPSGMSEQEKSAFQREIQRYTQAPVFFASEAYGTPYDLWTRQPVVHLPKRALGVAGLANPDYFQQHLAENIPNLAFQAFPDHYDYRPEDLKACFQFNGPVMITEKDAVKWKQFKQFQDKKVIVCPIQLQIPNQNEFDSLLLQWYAAY